MRVRRVTFKSWSAFGRKTGVRFCWMPLVQAVKKSTKR